MNAPVGTTNMKVISVTYLFIRSIYCFTYSHITVPIIYGCYGSDSLISLSRMKFELVDV
jgi:hypothetical protein